MGTFIVYEIDHVQESAARIYFSPAWGVEGLAQRLADAGIGYVVLRWFETLPEIAPGEDLDILVRDADVARFRSIVESEPGTLPIDLYSVSGLEGSDFRGAAYYVPHLAKKILDNSVVHVSGMRVPAPEEHLHSLAYHAAYHKGASSGLKSTLIEPVANPEHDYADALASVASVCGLHIPLELEALDDYLGSAGWRPPADALRRLASENEWLDRRAGGAVTAAMPGPQLAVFLVRERALDVLDRDEIVNTFERWGFEPLLVRELDPTTRERATRDLRGGNWERGPYPVSGGSPSLLLACVHHAPAAVNEALRQRYPHLSNADVYFVKQALRDLIDARVGAGSAFNAVHSADDDHEAWHYLHVVAPDDLQAVRGELEGRIAERQVEDDIVSTLSRGRRARVDVVESADGRVVRKTFTAGARRYMEREMQGMDALSGVIAAVPAILQRGERWFTMPFFDDALPSMSRPLPLALLRQMVGVLREIRANGFVLVDAKPDNFVLDRREGLRIVELACASRVEYASARLAEGPEFVEPDPTIFSDVPAGDSSYETRWLPHTGLPLAVLLDGTRTAQRFYRMRYAVGRFVAAPGSPVRRRLRGVRSVVRRGKIALRGGLERRAWGTRGRHANSYAEEVNAPDAT